MLWPGVATTVGESVTAPAAEIAAVFPAPLVAKRRSFVVILHVDRIAGLALSGQVAPRAVMGNVRRHSHFQRRDAIMPNSGADSLERRDLARGRFASARLDVTRERQFPSTSIHHPSRTQDCC